jgi:hypothetical protein
MGCWWSCAKIEVEKLQSGNVEKFLNWKIGRTCPPWRIEKLGKADLKMEIIKVNFGLDPNTIHSPVNRKLVLSEVEAS